MARRLSNSHRKAISEGLKKHHRSRGKRGSVLERSRHSKSGHKSWRARRKEKRPGLWANIHAKRHREARKHKRRR